MKRAAFGVLALFLAFVMAVSCSGGSGGSSLLGCLACSLGCAACSAGCTMCTGCGAFADSDPEAGDEWIEITPGASPIEH